MIEIDIAILVILIIIMIILGLILCLKIIKKRENNRKIANKAKTFHKNLNNKNMNRDIKNLENIMKNRYNIENKILDEYKENYENKRE
jgi:predicted Holliday junction resolvase-like endonuclease